MKRLLLILSLGLVSILGGCTAMMESSSYGTSDLYITDNRIKVAEEVKARAEAERAEAEARRAMWEARLAEAEYYAATGENYNSILANDYESAYARRLYGFSSPTYRLPSSYYNLATSDAMRYASAYDPAFYNIMLSGDQVWVEPKYVTSMFGSWGATNVTFGIYASPWAFGWGVHSYPFYYTMWGYPHYSWYDWNWNMCYNPYHWGCYPGYYHPHYGYPHHTPKPQPPHYRPNYKPGGSHNGAGDRYARNDRRRSASRYTSPTSNQNYGRNLNGSRVGTALRTNGSTSSGINHSTVVRGNSNSSSKSNNTRYSTSSSSRSNSSSSNFRSSSSSSSSSRSSSSSSSYRSSGSSSSSSRSSGGTTSSRR